MHDLPRITILTPSRNGAQFLEAALDSVARQGYPELEHIVLDACSTDGTRDILAKYPAISVIREPDGGSHDAMNKGVAVATGEVIGFLNTDDLYPDGILTTVGMLFASDPALDIVMGHSIVFEEREAGHRRPLIARAHAREEGLWLPELTFGVTGFNGTFFRRRVFDRIGLFNVKYAFTADRELLIRAALAGLKSRQLDQPAIWYRLHRGSRTINPDMPNLLPIGREQFHMAGEFGIPAAFGSAERRLFLAWHAFEGAKLILRALHRARFSEALEVLTRLASSDALWPLRIPAALSFRRQVRDMDTTTPLPARILGE